MDTHNVIMVTGAAGFIGSRLAAYLNEKGYDRLILVDAFDREDKSPNLADLKFLAKVERGELFQWLDDPANQPDFIFHLGARTDTTEFDYEIHRLLNLEYSKQVWDYCCRRQVPLVYASSAATYGGGELGYNDDHDIIGRLKPLNPYGLSKNEFDKWVLQQGVHPPFWAGLKFFNVYGPNEYHKGRMASVIWHAYNQIRNSGEVKLFRSHRPDFKDGEQLRDFIYVRDILKVCYWLMQARPRSAIYNLGTGKARSFADLARAVFTALDKKSNIQFIDMPLDIREKYQYFTEANMDKLRAAGYDEKFYSLEEGVKEYVQEFLVGRH
ncbi:MAG: ADP-glyceromanno-heptose 6-epimerase [Chitinophagaceae bacterium]|nr:ADP-glyceromanno-heptose 6-epimerase [Chitinophagaceae bacterium]